MSSQPGGDASDAEPDLVGCGSYPGIEPAELVAEPPARLGRWHDASPDLVADRHDPARGRRPGLHELVLPGNQLLVSVVAPGPQATLVHRLRQPGGQAVDEHGSRRGRFGEYRGKIKGFARAPVFGAAGSVASDAFIPFGVAVTWQMAGRHVVDSRAVGQHRLGRR